MTASPKGSAPPICGRRSSSSTSWPMLLVNEAEPAPAGERGISFGPFRLFPRQRLLLVGGKDELMARVWPNTIVDEGNLKFQVSALRRTLGGGTRYLVTVPGRGYSFAAPVA